MRSRRDVASLSAACILCIVLLLGYTTYLHAAQPGRALELTGPPSDHEVTLVVATQTSDDTAWLRNAFPNWKKLIYVTDNKKASLTVPANKGRENMVYLTYIIEHYDQLPDVSIFHHAQKYQWHNDDPLYDGERILERLQLAHVAKEGYVNLRCVWTLGCPSEIHPLSQDDDGTVSSERAGHYYRQAFLQLFPGQPVPENVGASCCAQFAVTSKKIRERSLDDYKRYRKWLLETPLADDLSGRIMEYTWHIIFGRESVHCPPAADCYCKAYGLCDLECGDEGTCESQYTLPPYSTMPKGWPDYDWQGEWVNVTSLRAEQALRYRPVSEPG